MLFTEDMTLEAVRAKLDRQGLLFVRNVLKRKLFFCTVEDRVGGAFYEGQGLTWSLAINDAWRRAMRGRRYQLMITQKGSRQVLDVLE